MAFNNLKPSSTTSKADRGGMDTLIRAEKMTQIAFILPAGVLVGWLGGGLCDRWLHTHWLYIVGILLGVVAGFVQIFRLIAVSVAEPNSAASPATASAAGEARTTRAAKIDTGP